MSQHSEELLEFAQFIAEDPNASQADIRRAVSACYYALFHILCMESVKIFYGKIYRKNSPANETYDKIYRAINHRRLKNVCDQYKKNEYNSIPIMKKFAAFIFDMQGKRHTADYAPFHKEHNISHGDLQMMARETERQIHIWKKRNPAQRRDFLIDVLFPDRKN